MLVNTRNDVSMDIAQERHRQFRGLARVRLNNLEFTNVLDQAKHRPLSPRNVARLRHVFTLEGCQRYEEANFISGLIEVDDNDSATPLQPPDVSLIPLLEPRTPIRCLNGLHRIRAAQEYLDANDQWWIVKLYSEGCSSLETTITEEAQNERPISDGEIFRKIRSYHRSHQTDLENKWWARLTESKRKDLRQLLKNAKYAEAFDRLLLWPGLWSPIQLGTLHRLLTMRCDEELLCYLAHIEATWRIILADTGFENAENIVDDRTVYHLQALAPGVSMTDSAKINLAIHDGSLFPSIKEPSIRIILCENICRITGLIPSLHTLFEFLKYLEPCSKVLRDLLPLKFKRSLRQELFSFYFPQDKLTIEHAESHFRTRPSVTSEMERNIGYWQLWLFALRHFPDLTSMPPRKELKKMKPATKQPNPALKRRLGELAFQLGFHTPLVMDHTKQDAERDLALRFVSECGGSVPECETEIATLKSIANTVSRKTDATIQLNPPKLTDIAQVPLDRRIGRPYEDAFAHDRAFLFLPYFRSCAESAVDITTFYATMDMFITFFGVEIDKLPDFVDSSVTDLERYNTGGPLISGSHAPVCHSNDCGQVDTLRSGLQSAHEKIKTLNEEITALKGQSQVTGSSPDTSVDVERRTNEVLDNSQDVQTQLRRAESSLEEAQEREQHEIRKSHQLKIFLAEVGEELARYVNPSNAQSLRDKSQVTDADHGPTGSDTEISSLRKTMSSLKCLLDQFKREKHELDAQVKDLIRQNDSLAETNREQSSELQTKRTEVDGLRKENDGLSRGNINLNHRVSELVEEGNKNNEDVQHKISRQDQRITDLTNEGNQLISTYSKQVHQQSLDLDYAKDESQRAREEADMLRNASGHYQKALEAMTSSNQAIVQTFFQMEAFHSAVIATTSAKRNREIRDEIASFQPSQDHLCLVLVQAIRGVKLQQVLRHAQGPEQIMKVVEEILRFCSNPLKPAVLFSRNFRKIQCDNDEDYVKEVWSQEGCLYLGTEQALILLQRQDRVASPSSNFSSSIHVEEVAESSSQGPRGLKRPRGWYRALEYPSSPGEESGETRGDMISREAPGMDIDMTQ